MRKWTALACSAVCALLLSSAVIADDSAVLKYVPSDANTLAVLRVKELIQSPRGQREGWAEQHETEFLQGAATIPPWATEFIRASYVRPGTRGGDWTVVLLPLPQGYEISQLAKREGTEVQEIGNLPAVASNRYGGYFVEFGGAGESKILGGIVPASRQDAARWVREVGGAGSAPISDYLSAAAADMSSQIVLAIDLRDMLDPIMIRNRIDQSTVVAQAATGKAALKVDFQSLQGVRFSIHTADETTAELRLDFGRNIGDEGQQIKALVNEFFNDAGAALDELEQAQTKVSGKSVTLTMPLSDESLRRVLSMITTPTPPTAAGRQVPVAPTPTPDESTPDLVASRRYFNAVNRNIDDLEKARGRASSYARTAQWHTNFADRIDRLPTAGVDPALVTYASDISARLRALAASLRGTAVQVNALDRSVVYNVEQHPVYRNGFEWWWGGAYTAYGPYTYGQPVETTVTSNLEEVRGKQAEVVQATEPDRTQIWNIILEDRAQLQREMVGKFGADFQKR